MVSIPRPFAFPDRISTTETYVHIGQFATGAAGVPAVYSFRLNSTFDPDLTAAGHQPYARDQLAALYAKYRVMTVNYRLEAICRAEYAQMSCTPCPSSNITFATPSEGAEQPYGSAQHVHPYASTYWTGHVDLPRLMGQNVALYRGDDSNEAAVGNNPANTPIIQIVTQNSTGAVATSSIIVTLVYHVEYFNLTPQMQS